MIGKIGFRIVGLASEEQKIQGGRRSLQNMSHVPDRKQQKVWNLKPSCTPSRLKLLPWAVLSLLSPSVLQPDGQWLVVYPGSECRMDRKDFQNSSLSIFVGLDTETLPKWFQFASGLLKQKRDQTQMVLI